MKPKPTTTTPIKTITEIPGEDYTGRDLPARFELHFRWTKIRVTYSGYKNGLTDEQIETASKWFTSSLRDLGKSAP